MGLEQSGRNAAPVPTQGKGQIRVSRKATGLIEVGGFEVVDFDPADRKLFGGMFDILKGVFCQTLSSPDGEFPFGKGSGYLKLATADGIGEDAHGMTPVMKRSPAVVAAGH